MTDFTSPARPLTAHEAGVITGLCALADFLEQYPDLIPPFSVDISHHPHGTDEHERAEVDRIAATLGVTAQDKGAGHYVAQREFGPVTYSAVAIAAESMRRYKAHMQPYNEAEEALAARDEATA